MVRLLGDLLLASGTLSPPPPSLPSSPLSPLVLLSLLPSNLFPFPPAFPSLPPPSFPPSPRPLSAGRPPAGHVGSAGVGPLGLGLAACGHRGPRRPQLAARGAHAHRLHLADPREQRVLRALHLQHLLQEGAQVRVATVWWLHCTALPHSHSPGLLSIIVVTRTQVLLFSVTCFPPTGPLILPSFLPSPPLTPLPVASLWW